MNIHERFTSTSFQVNLISEDSSAFEYENKAHVPDVTMIKHITEALFHVQTIAAPKHRRWL